MKMKSFLISLALGCMASAAIATGALPTLPQAAFAQSFRDFREGDDPRIEPVRIFDAANPLRGYASPVGVLDIVFADGTESTCTAFILSSQFIMTNAHCIPGDFNGSEFVGEYIESPRATRANLTMGFLFADERGTENFPVDIVPAESSRIFDFSVLRVSGNPARRWGAVELSLINLAADQEGLIVHHPGGEPLQVTRRNCALIDASPVSDDTQSLIGGTASSDELTSIIRFETSCAIRAGSSGAPFISAQSGQVMGLISSGDDVSNRSQAIPISVIASASQIVRDLATARAQPPSRGRKPGTEDEDIASKTPLSEPQDLDMPSLEPGQTVSSIASFAGPAFPIDPRCASAQFKTLGIIGAWTISCDEGEHLYCTAALRQAKTNTGLDITVFSQPAGERGDSFLVEVILGTNIRAAEGHLNGKDWDFTSLTGPGILTPGFDGDDRIIIDEMLAVAAHEASFTLTSAARSYEWPLADFDNAFTAALVACGFVEKA